MSSKGKSSIERRSGRLRTKVKVRDIIDEETRKVKQIIADCDQSGRLCADMIHIHLCMHYVLFIHFPLFPPLPTLFLLFISLLLQLVIAARLQSLEADNYEEIPEERGDAAYEEGDDEEVYSSSKKGKKRKRAAKSSTGVESTLKIKHNPLEVILQEQEDEEGTVNYNSIAAYVT